MFVTSRPILGTALAFAGHCQEDTGSETPYLPRRPVMGHINVDPASLGDPTEWYADAVHAQTVDSILKVLIHEAMHVLGFTYEKILEFPCPDSPSFNRFEPGSAAPRSCATANSPNPVGERSHMSNGVLHSERRILTPKVLQMARAHYNCPQTANQLAAGGSQFSCAQDTFEHCMDGVPIENNGGDGTAASHWEKRIMNGRRRLLCSTMSTLHTTIRCVPPWGTCHADMNASRNALHSVCSSYVVVCRRIDGRGCAVDTDFRRFYDDLGAV